MKYLNTIIQKIRKWFMPVLKITVYPVFVTAPKQFTQEELDKIQECEECLETAENLGIESDCDCPEETFQVEEGVKNIYVVESTNHPFLWFFQDKDGEINVMTKDSKEMVVKETIPGIINRLSLTNRVLLNYIHGDFEQQS